MLTPAIFGLAVQTVRVSRTRGWKRSDAKRAVKEARPVELGARHTTAETRSVLFHMADDNKRIVRKRFDFHFFALRPTM
jgi:hypothetical protein